MATKKSYKLNSQSKKRILALAIIMMCFALVAFFVATVSSEIGFGAEASTDEGSGHVDATVDTFAETVNTGASVTIKATDEDTRGAGSVANASVSVTEVATVTFDSSLVTAFKTGRLTAELYVSGYNTLEVLAGNKTASIVNYEVSGALSGSGSISHTDFEKRGSGSISQTDFEELKLNTKKGSSFETLTFKYSVLLTSGNTSNSTDADSYAKVSADCNVNIILKLTFDEGVVDITIQKGGALYKDGTLLAEATDVPVDYEHSVPFSEVLNYCAEPQNGYYFVGWKFSERDIRTGKTISLGTSDNPIGYGFEMTEDISVTAVFQLLTLQNNSAEFSYNTQMQGPSVVTSFESSYKVVNLYSGTIYGMPTEDSEGKKQTEIQENYKIYNQTQKPSLAGEYTHYGYIYYQGTLEEDCVPQNAVGKTENKFKITKNVPTFERDDAGTEQIINYGGTLEEVTLTGKAYNSAKITEKLTNSGTVGIFKPVTNDQNEVTDYVEVKGDDLTKLLVPGTYDYYIRFTPDDVYNYTYCQQQLTITVQDLITDSAYNVNGGTRAYTVEKSIVTEADTAIPNNLNGASVSGEVIKVSLRATMTDTSGNYFFIGWRIKLSGATTYLISGKMLEDGTYDGLKYDYYMPRVGALKSAGTKETYSREEVDAYMSAEFIAVFIRDTGTPEDSNDLSVTYTGGARLFMPSFNPGNAGNGFGYSTPIKYYDSEGTELANAPKDIGNYTIKYVIRNTELDVEVGERVINYNVVAGVVSAELNESRSIAEGNYNSATGWAKKKYYTLSVKDMVGGAVSKYQYKTSADSDTWKDIEGTIGTGSGCRITFETPVTASASTVNTYVFRAIYKADESDIGVIVAETSGTGVECKIDATSPNIDTITGTLNGATYDGAWTNDQITYTTRVGYGGSGAVIDVMYKGESSSWVKLDSNIAFLTGSDTSYDYHDVTFSISKEYTGYVRFRVRNGVGETNESSNELLVNIDKSAPALGDGENNQNVNINGWIGVDTKITFTVVDNGGSGVKEISSDDTEVTKESDGVYSIIVTDSAHYAIKVWDNAGNYSEKEYYAPVDTIDLTYALATDSVQGNGWINSKSVVAFDVSVGASGARLLYSTDGTTYMACNSAFGFDSGSETGIGARSVRLEYELDLADGEYEYWFRLENGAGKQQDYNFGFVGVDSVNPEFSEVTDLSAYQGVTWTANAVYAEFKVTDSSQKVSSGIKSVVSDNGGEVVYNETTGKYSLKIDKCTPFTVTVTDNAGNIAEYVFKANVDTIEPTLDIHAYVGGGDPTDIAVVPSGSYREYDFASWITASEKEPWIRLEFTINLTASGSALEISEDNGATWRAITETYRPEGNAVTGTVSTRTYITEEQNKSYKFRLSTGSGRKVTFDPVADGEAYVRIDFTAPVIRSSTYVSGFDSNFPAETEWTSNTATIRALFGDTAGGSGVNYDTIALYEFDINTPDSQVVLENIGSAVKREMIFSGTYYTYEFIEYNKYLLTFEDNAGNVYEGSPFAPKVDLTKDFELELSTAIRTEGGTGSYDYTSGTWLNNNQYVEFIGTPVFNNVDYTSFGPSGAQMQFSVDGGASWDTSVTVNGVTSAVYFDEASGKYVYATSGDQILTYKFRIITGAGVKYELDGEYSVKRDGVTPTVNAVANIVSEGTQTAYDGSWTKDNVDITVTIEYGVSGGTLEVRSGDAGDWQEIKAIGVNTVATGEDAGTHTYTIDYSYNGKVYFRYVSNKVVDGSAVSVQTDGTDVRLDNKAIEASVTAKGAGDADIANGGWSYGELTVKASVTAGESGISAVYVSYAIDGTFGDYELVSPTDGEYKVKFSAESEDGSAYRSYKFKAVSVSGVEAETEVYSVGTDNAVIALAPEYVGTKVSSLDGIFTDWYLTTVIITLNPDKQNASGYKFYYTYEESDGEGGWVPSNAWTEVNNVFSIGYKEDGTPDNRAGGLDRRYSFKTVTGAGKELVYSDEGNEWAYLPIDLHTYSLKFTNYVGTIEVPSVECATVRGEGVAYKRGDKVNIGYTPSGTYRFKSTSIEGLDSNVNSLEIEDQETADNNYSIASVNLYIGGGDVNITVQLYKEVILTYSNTEQYLQEGRITNIGVTASEDGFTSLFGTPGFGADAKIPLVAEYVGGDYNGTVPPQAIGEYQVTVSVSGDLSADYFVSSGSVETSLTVVYFTGNGTEQDPYLVKEQADFKYIDIYGSDGYDYLGANRKRGYFKQIADIYVNSTFKPIGGEGDGFEGTYDGNGYRVIGTSTFNVEGDFGFFRKIKGASVLNLGVELDVKGSAGNIGYIASEAVSSGIRACYAIGDISVSGSDICVGGLVGKADATLVSLSFADVKIEVDKSDGYVGGVIGRAIKSYTSEAFTVSAIAVTDSQRYDSGAEVGTKYLYAGAILGYVEKFTDIVDNLAKLEVNSYYLDKNVSYDGSIETGLSIGNEHSVSNYNALRHVGADIDAFASESYTYDGKNTATTLIQNISERNYTITVKELTYMRIEREKEGKDVDGNGTSDDPFIVDEVTKLGLIEIFPWAYFKQTADIEVGVTSGYAYSVPFVGIYDGNGFSLRNVVIAVEHNQNTVCYGGLFGVNGGTIKNLTVLDINYDYTVDGIIYAGGLVGYAKEGSVIENVVITGGISITGDSATVYAGGVVGYGYDTTIHSAVTLVGVEVNSGFAVTGGVIGLIKGNSVADDVVAISSVSVDVSRRADTGAVIGAVAGVNSSVTNVGYLVSSCYVGGKLLEVAVGVNGGIDAGTRAYSYSDLAGSGANVTVNGKAVYEIIDGLYPFEGKGTKDNPFKISTYEELLQIGSYMYAYFELTDDIWVGDYDADGVVDEDYKYDYSPIGGGAAFTGQLNGKKHTIFGLTDSLFAINAGSVSEITLNVSYKVYASENDIPDEDKFIDASGNTVVKAKVGTPGEDILFGAVARVNRDTGSILRVVVTGEISIKVSGKAKVTVGGLVGTDFGGSIAGVTVSADMYVRASYADVGGIVGAIYGNGKALETMGTSKVTMDQIDVGGSTVHAGVFVGAVKVVNTSAPNYAADTKVIVNGTDLGTVYVGYEK